jgi:multidrug efflux system membrane fusion protein
MLVATLAVGCTGKEAAPEGRGPVAVRVRPVEAQPASGATRYSGAVQPMRQVDLSFKVAGYIDSIAEVKDGDTKRPIQEGDPVKKGAVLAQVRADEYRQRSAAASASVLEAEAAEKQAQLDADRASKLFESGAATQAEKDNTQVRLDAARARVAAAKAQAGQADLVIGDTSLVSPMDGVVLKKPIEVGALVNAGSVGFVVADVSTVKVIFGVPDTLVEKLSEGSPVTVTLEAHPGELAATVARISPSADPKSRVFDVEVRLPNPDGRLKPGMIASLKVPDAALASESVMLPLTAVVRSKSDPRGFAVFVVAGDTGKETVAARDVKLGDVLGNLVIVKDGLKGGERVVSQGATLVVDGDSVRIIP